MNLIVAVDENWGIGYKNELLCHIKEDLKRFKKFTSGNVVVMGRKTWGSLPTKPLPNRTNIVITNSVEDMQINNGVIYTKLDLFKRAINDIGKKFNVFVIGGSQIYKELLPYCDYVLLTKIHKSFSDADAYFPNIDALLNWKLIETSNTKKEEDIEYHFCFYKNKEKENGRRDKNGEEI